MTSVVTTTDYTAFLTTIKTRVVQARTSAARAVNRELVLLYWDIGRGIMEKQQAAGWGEAVVERLAADLRAEFPEIRGFSTANLWAMRRFYVEYGCDPILQQLVEELPKEARLPGKQARGTISLQQLIGEIPWGHHLLLLDKVKPAAARFYYLRATAQLAWLVPQRAAQPDQSRCL